MSSKIFMVLAVLVIAVAVIEAQKPAKNCKSNSECSVKCCHKGKCADSMKYCPCEQKQRERKWPCKKGEICVNQEVQCVKAPCYPVAECRNSGWN